MATTYVTFLVKSATDPVEPAQRIEWLKPLLTLDIDLVLCVDDFYLQLVPQPFPNRLRILVIDLEKFETRKQIREAAPSLPPYRNNTKDTLDYMCIQNSKPELLLKAMQLVYTPFVAYIDAGISKVCRNHETLKRLETYQFRDIPLVLLPGCHPMPQAPLPHKALSERICWTFCGGFFVVPSNQVKTLYELHSKAVAEFLNQGCITWEVNVWASYLPITPGVCWYAGDHNDTMLMPPVKNCTGPI